MPRFKNVSSLYNQCIQVLHYSICNYCSFLDDYEEVGMPDGYVPIEIVHNRLVTTLPTKILDDLLEFHAALGNPISGSLKSYYFYRLVAYKNLRRFKSRNYSLNLLHWQTLFRTFFTNLVTLNLALSCNDKILELIPQYCPNLENLNATCRYERLETGANACIFALSVTDYGLGFICQCKKLRTIILNEPRSNRRGMQNGITYNGLRRLLIHVTTLEDISYSDLGSVVAEGLEHIQNLNLKIIRHFNATEKSIKEILRLCTNLRHVYLTFFSASMHDKVWKEIINSKLNLTALEVMNLNCKNLFTDLFESIGFSLKTLSISNTFSVISFSNLVTIGRYCPNLSYFNCSNLISRLEEKPKNFGQFANLEFLQICGDITNIETVLMLCTENAENLENLLVTERSLRAVNVDRIFCDHLYPKKIRHLEVSMSLFFTTYGIRKLISKLPVLNYLSVPCADDCRDLIQEIKQMNYDLVFINRKLISF